MGEQVAARNKKRQVAARNKKRKRQNRCREKFIIDTGKDEQQLIAADPVSRAVLL